jgi:hypothetical protein
MHPIDSNKVNNRFILCINLTKISNIYEAVISILLLSNLRRKLFNRKNLLLQIYKCVVLRTALSLFLATGYDAHQSLKPICKFLCLKKSCSLITVPFILRFNL